jgi:hypothetical protein
MKTVNALHIEIQANNNETKYIEQNDTKKKLSGFCLDVAKFIFTGVFFTTIFALIKNVLWLVLLSGFITIVLISFGIVLNKLK